MRFALVLLAATACVQPRSKTCTDICARESDCVTATNSQLPFDEKECIAACSALEQDPDNLAKVQKHYDCVIKNRQTCASVLECD